MLRSLTPIGVLTSSSTIIKKRYHKNPRDSQRYSPLDDDSRTTHAIRPNEQPSGRRSGCSELVRQRLLSDAARKHFSAMNWSSSVRMRVNSKLEIHHHPHKHTDPHLREQPTVRQHLRGMTARGHAQHFVQGLKWGIPQLC